MHGLKLVHRLFIASRHFFHSLNSIFLDHNNPHHLWLILCLFLEDINNDCHSFQEDWNAHPISGCPKSRSPNIYVIHFHISFILLTRAQDMCLIGMLKSEVYLNDLEGVNLGIDVHKGIGIGRDDGALSTNTRNIDDFELLESH